MQKISLLLLLFIFLISPALVQAHISVENRFYEDIEFSKAKEQIVLLRGLNAIMPDNGAKVFRPQNKLSRADLAYWSASFRKLAGAQASREQLEQAATDHRLLESESLEGVATYGDVNQAYFDGKAPTPDAKQEITREQFALYMGEFLTKPVNGKTLYELAGFAPGPAGIIDKVTSQPDEGQFHLSIAGNSYPLSQHPVILGGTVDLGAWTGMKIGTSWMAMEDGQKVVRLLQIDNSPLAFKSEQAKALPAEQKMSPVLPIIAIVFMSMLLIQFYVKRKRRSAGFSK